MTPEEIERTMQFILQQQAKFSVDNDKINETIDRINETLAKHSEALVGLIGLHGKVIQTLDRVAELQQGHATKIAELAEAGKRTDERLDALITTVEKYIAGRNGRGIRKQRRGKRK
jgi:copper oxidase (laccase) domain-containing protein